MTQKWNETDPEKSRYICAVSHATLENSHSLYVETRQELKSRHFGNVTADAPDEGGIL